MNPTNCLPYQWFSTRLLHAAVLLALLTTLCVSVARAQTFPLTCISCHGGLPGPSGPPSIAISTGPGSFVFGLSESWMNSAFALRTRVNNAGVSGMPTITDTEASSIWNYLVDLRDAVVSTPSPAFSDTPLGFTSTNSFAFTIANRRNHSLTYTLLPITGTHAGNFSITSHTVSGPSGCSVGNVPAASNVSLAPICTVNVTVAFTPSGAGNRSALLGVNLSSGSNNPQPLTRSFALNGNGLEPIVVSATTLSIGASVGSPMTGTVMVTNKTSSPVTINSISFSGTYAAEFTRDATSTCVPGSPISASTFCSLHVRFDPANALPPSRLASVNIAHSAFGSPLSVTLQGNAAVVPQGILEISASSLSFPSTQIGSTAPLPLTLRNVGSAALTLNAFRPGGSHPTDFVRSGTCSASAALAINAECTLTISFGPSALGLRSASLTIDHNGANSSAVISLSGTGIPVPLPVAALEPTSGLNFGMQTVGGLYPARTLRLTNSGTAAMTVASVAVEGTVFTNASPAPCPATLAPAESCEIQIRFAAASAGTTSSGAVRIVTNAAGSPHIAPLSGSGTLAAVPVLEWVPAVTQFNFGAVSVGAISPVQSATLHTAGPGGVTLTLINSVGVDASMFAAGSTAPDAGACNAGRVLFQGQDCRVDVRFAPGANGIRSATLQVVSTGSAPSQLTLLGTGLSGPLPSMTLAPTALKFDTARVGSTSAPLEVAIQSAGAGALTVQSLSTSGPFRMEPRTCLSPPFTLQGGSACTIAMVFAPESEGDASGALTVVSDASSTSQRVVLSARAEARAQVSGGGCSISDGRSPADPTLWVLVLLAAGVLLYRRRRPGTTSHDGHTRRGSK